MGEQAAITQNERGLAGLAHGSILLGLFTGGVGGILAALVIWLSQKDKSDYVAGQSLQALVYQSITYLITMAFWCCWGLMWTVAILVPLVGNPEAYESSPPATLWLGLFLLIVPLGVWGLTLLYGLYGAARCFGGHAFKYVIVGNWMESHE